MDIELYEHGLALFRGALSDSVCDGLVEGLKSSEKPFMLMNHETAHYGEGTQYEEKCLYMEDSSRLSAFIAQQLLDMQAAYFSLLGLSSVTCISSFINPLFKRYRRNSNDQFLIHYDARDDVSSRSLAFIWYLNDVKEGGETTFPFLDVAVQPEKGCCIVFPPYWNFMHLARKPVSDDKYTLNAFGMV